MSTPFLKFLCEFLVVPKLIGHLYPNFLHILLYGQATQDGCSLALCASPAQPEPASPTPTHVADLPAYLFQAPACDCPYQRGSEGRAPLLVSLVTNELT